MQIQDTTVVSNKKIAENTYLIEVQPSELAEIVKPGQFFNIQVSETSFPLLRRPFSISDVIGDSIFFMYKVVGTGTKILSEKKSGDKLNLLGPLGNNFVIDQSVEHYIILGGGIGIAPFPLFIKKLSNNSSFSVLFGVRNKNEAHEYGISNIKYSSDDGTIGVKGTVIDLLKMELNNYSDKKIKIVACGPNPMLRALKLFASENNLDCEVSMESAMACGFGICQGCPIEFKNSETYKLICHDGPVFNIRDIEI